MEVICLQDEAFYTLIPAGVPQQQIFALYGVKKQVTSYTFLICNSSRILYAQVTSEILIPAFGEHLLQQQHGKTYLLLVGSAIPTTAEIWTKKYLVNNVLYILQ